MNLDPQRIASAVLGFLIALTIHEYAHARSALAAGDDTAKLAGRVSLNPLDHLDFLGTIAFLFTVVSGFGLGWGKPVPVNTLRLRSPRWDNLKVSLWGPLSNLLMATLLSLLLRVSLLAHGGNTLNSLILNVILFNLAIGMFNLIPIPPLDGSHILSSLLPYEAARKYDNIIGRFGFYILLALLFTGAVGFIIGGPLFALLDLLLYGIPKDVVFRLLMHGMQ